MKSLFIYAIFKEDLDKLPDDIEYLFINTLNVDKVDDYIKPNININFKFMYVHRLRIGNYYYDGSKLDVCLPFNANYFYNRRSFMCHNLEIEKKDLFYYIDELQGDDSEEVFKDLIYWFNIISENYGNKYSYQHFIDSICIFNILSII